MVCVGAATRLVPFVQDLTKAYRAVFQLGCTSDTDDITGDVVPVEDAIVPALADLESAARGFVGEISQVPPRFSAVHVQGTRAYRLAREGRIPVLSARAVTIHRLSIVSYEYPRLELDIECSSGTYVRSIGRDLGAQLRCGAVMSELSRTRIGPFALANAIPLVELTPERLSSRMLSSRVAVTHLPERWCTIDELREIRHGRPIPAGAELRERPVAHAALLSPSGALAALATNLSDSAWLAPTHVFPDCFPASEIHS